MCALQRAAILAAAILTSGFVSAQSTWYVDVNAPAPGNGTPASPYHSIQFAHDQTTTHNLDTILVAPGTYVENVTLSKRITVRATAGADRTTLRPAVAGSILILFGPADEPEALTVEGFTITGVFGFGGTAAVRSYDGRLLHCLVAGNRGNSYYGVETGYDTLLVNCTIAGNDLGVEQSAVDIVRIRNSVVWGNTFNYVHSGSFGTTITYSAGGPFPVAGTGNMNFDAGLWNIAAGDYHIRPGSPCIDAGDPALPNDPDGSRSDVGYQAFDPLHAFGPQTYCTAKVNSQGCTPEIAASGLASLTSANPFLVTATNVLPGRRGLLMYGFGQANLSFQGGKLCMQQPLHRSGLQTSAGSGTCGGTYAWDFNVQIQGGYDPALVPGTLVYAQWLSIDPGDPFGIGLTNAVSFGIAP